MILPAPASALRLPPAVAMPPLPPAPPLALTAHFNNRARLLPPRRGLLRIATPPLPPAPPLPPLPPTALISNPRTLVDGSVRGREADGSGHAAVATQSAGAAARIAPLPPLPPLPASAWILASMVIPLGALKGNHAALAAVLSVCSGQSGQCRIWPVGAIAADSQQRRLQVN